MPTKALLDLLAVTRPTLRRVEYGDNAGVIMGAVTDGIRQIAQACDYDSAERNAAIAAVRTDMMSGNYEHLCEVARTYFILDGDEE